MRRRVICPIWCRSVARIPHHQTLVAFLRLAAVHDQVPQEGEITVLGIDLETSFAAVYGLKGPVNFDKRLRCPPPSLLCLGILNKDDGRVCDCPIPILCDREQSDPSIQPLQRIVVGSPSLRLQPARFR